MKIDLQLHKFWSVVVKGQQEHLLWGFKIIHKYMGLGTKQESNGSENHQKSASMGTRVNIPRLNNILSLNISKCVLFLPWSSGH